MDRSMLYLRVKTFLNILNGVARSDDFGCKIKISDAAFGGDMSRLTAGANSDPRTLGQPLTLFAAAFFHHHTTVRG
ncbi:MAG: hypothetical protein M0Z45_10875 [Actinomycetota bacterium]|nr:hypothetical protein [Actinomycetota bacterium]